MRSAQVTAAVSPAAARLISKSSVLRALAGLAVVCPLGLNLRGGGSAQQRRNREGYGRIAIASFVERPVGRNSELDEGLSAQHPPSTRPLSRARRVWPT